MNTLYFRTSSFQLVTFLYCKGEQIAGIYPTDIPSKKEFSFVISPTIERLVDIYKFGDRKDPELLVHASLYEQSRRELLDRLNDR